MAGGGLVEGARDHLALDAALHVRHFLGPLIDEQHDEEDLRVVGGDGVGDVLQQDGLARARRSHDEGALALAQGRHEVHHPGAQFLGIPLHAQVVFGVEGHQIIEVHPLLGHAGRVEVHGVHPQHGEELLALLGCADHPREGVARTQVEFADLAGGDVDVFGARQVVLVGTAQEAEALGQHLQHAFGEELALGLGLGLEHTEYEFLLPHGKGALDGQALGQIREFADGQFLELLQAQGGRGLRRGGHRSPQG